MSVRKRPRYGVAPLGQLAAKTILRTAGRVGRSYLQNQHGKTSRQASHVLTNQYDFKNVYTKRKRRIPKRVKRFQRKVRNVIFKQLAANQFVITDNFTRAWSTGTQGVTGMTLLGYSGAFAAQQNDCFRVFDALYAAGSSPLQAAIEENTRLVMSSAVVDFTFRNADTDDTIDLDVYTLICRKDIPAATFGQGAAVPGTIQADFERHLGNTPKFDQTGLSNLGFGTIGVTPFQSSRFCAAWTIKSKKKFILSPGQVANYQYRMKKNIWIRGGDLTTNASLTSQLAAKRGITVGFLFIANSVPKNGTFPSGSLDWSSVKTFNAKLMSREVNTLTGV